MNVNGGDYPVGNVLVFSFIGVCVGIILIHGFFSRINRKCIEKEEQEEERQMIKREQMGFEKNYKEFEEEFKKLVKEKFVYESWVHFVGAVCGSHKVPEGWSVLDKRIRDFLVKEKEDSSDKKYIEKLMSLIKEQPICDPDEGYEFVGGVGQPNTRYDEQYRKFKLLGVKGGSFYEN